MNQNNNTVVGSISKSAGNEPKKLPPMAIIAFVVCCMFPALFLVFIPIAIIIYASKNKTDGYSADHKTNVGGSGEGVRQEILLHEKPVDYNKSTYDIYNELLNKKTDYSGVNKDLL